MIAGCSQSEPGTASPTASGSTTADSVVPAVDVPLDAAAYLNEPCRLVEQEFMHSIGYNEAGQAATEENNSTAALSGPGCDWDQSEGIAGLGFTIQTGNQTNGLGGLEGNYDAHIRGQYSFWEPTTVDQYPAAFSDLTDARAEGRCRIVVGIADDLSFAVTADGYDEPTRACEDVEAVAGEIIQTLKRGS
ncbi:DUF3558 domain-containing protein [Saccharomonospora sp. NPDC046836]|uniref:DUF3558 domain-containing protein n=1 Tax=Saccharomonospora sp. NPDC046836 TaxID=3156921 RepID=UPI0033DB5072